MGDVIPFKKDEELTIEHVDASTIVEKIKWTPELKQKFADVGINIEENDNENRKD